MVFNATKPFTLDEFKEIKKKKIHIFLPQTRAIILCNQRGNMLRGIEAEKTEEYIKENKELMCKKCIEQFNSYWKWHLDFKLW